MDHGDLPRIFIYADAGNQRRNAGADILAHNDGDRRAVCDAPRQRKCL